MPEINHGNSHSRSHLLLMAAAGASIVVFLLLAVSSALTRRPWCDEAFFADPAFNLVTNGSMGTTVLEPTSLTWLRPYVIHQSPTGTNPLPSVREYTYWITPLDIVLLAGWDEIFGFSLFSMRALSMIWGLVALGSWYWIMKALSQDRKLALLTVCFLAVDYEFITAASVGRMDMMSAALGFAGLAVYLNLRERNLLLAVLGSQALVMASGLTHPNGGVLAFIGLLFLTLYLDRARLTPRHLAVAVIPYLAGAAGWGLYIRKNPASFLIQFRANAAGRFATLASVLPSLLREVPDRYLVVYGLGFHASASSQIKLLLLVAYVTGFVAAIWTPSIRRHPGFRILLLLAGIYLSTLTLIDSTKRADYLIYSVPFLCATWVLWISWTWVHRSLPRSLILIGASAVVFVQLGAILYRVVRVNTYQNMYEPAVNFLRSTVPKGSAVMGSAELGFGLGFDSNLIDDPTLGYYTGNNPAFVVEQGQAVGEGCSRWILDDEKAFKGYQEDQHKIFSHVRKLLSEDFQLVYDHPPYQIYARR